MGVSITPHSSGEHAAKAALRGPELLAIALAMA
jgi:hypothetical protein